MKRIISTTLTFIQGNYKMPEFDQTTPNTGAQAQNNKADEQRRSRRSKKTTPPPRVNSKRRIGSALGINSDKTRSGLFNTTLKELLKDTNHEDIFVFGKVADVSRASVNYIGIKNDDGSILAIATIFENKGGYEVDTKKDEVFFTYDMLKDKTDTFLTTVIDAISEDTGVDEKDITIADAQVVTPDFEVNEDTVRTMTYALGTLLENLSGAVPEDINLEDFGMYSARLRITPGATHTALHEHRSDFSITCDQHTQNNRKFSPTIMGDDEVSSTGPVIVTGFADLEYTGPEEDPNDFNDKVKSFKPEQFTLKLAVTCTDATADESFVYERSILALASLGEMHDNRSGVEVLTRLIDSDKSIDLSALIKQMWVPEELDLSGVKIKTIDDIQTNLDFMIIPQETYITILHRFGDASNGLGHIISKIGGGDRDYLGAFLAALDAIDGGDGKVDPMSERLADYLNVDEISCKDIVIESTPRVFGTYSDASGRRRPLETIGLLQVAKAGLTSPEIYGEWVAATSIDHREMDISESQKFQIAFLTEQYNGVEITGNGAEYQINPDLILFLYRELDALHNDVEFSGFVNCNPERNRFHRTRDRDRRVLRNTSQSGRRNDRHGSGFGRLRR